MRTLAALFALIAVAVAGEATPAGHPSALILADESVRFDGARPVFTPNQIANCSEATRAGLVRWASTAEGRTILDRLDAAEYAIVVTEDATQPTPGRAPQPGIATLAAAGDHAKLKVYEIVVNPALFHPVKADVAVVPPLTAADMMALAWAAEMLHIDFYARGISLPHHRREDFQREWHEVAAELGMPNVPHEDEVNDPSGEQPPSRARGRRHP